MPTQKREDDKQTYLYHLSAGLRNALVEAMLDLLNDQDQRWLLCSAEAKFISILMGLNPDIGEPMPEADALVAYRDGMELVVELYIERAN